MNENEIVSNQNINEDVTTQHYIDAIQQLKANSVDISKYEALREDNQKLLNALVNGGSTESQSAVEEVKMRDPQEIRKELFDIDNPLSNLDYVTKAIELREVLLAKGERDPFLPYGQNIAPTEEDIKKANNAAEVMKHCIEYADGDDEVFTNELQRLTDDAMPLRGRRR